MKFRTLVLAVLLSGCLADPPPATEAPDPGMPGGGTATPGAPDAGSLPTGSPRPASCTPAPCRAEIVVEQEGSAVGIAADDQHVYWAGGEPRRVLRWPTAGGAIEDVVAPTTVEPFFVTVDESQLAWTTGVMAASVWRTPLPLGGGAARVAENPVTFVRPVATGGLLYYATSGYVWRLRGEGSIPEIVLQTSANASALAADASGAYAVDASVGRLLHGDGTGDEPRVLAELPAQRSVPMLAVDAEHVYLLMRHGDATCRTTLARVAKAGGELTALLTEERCGMDLVVDQAHVYWMGFESGGPVTVLARVPKAGGSVELLAGGLPYTWNLAQNTTHVYWTEPSPARVLRLAK